MFNECGQCRGSIATSLEMVPPETIGEVSSERTSFFLKQQKETRMSLENAQNRGLFGVTST